MAQVGRLGNIMFWLMLALGGALLAPCLILPPWLEYRASLDLKTLRHRQVEAHRAEVTKLRQQRLLLERDDAYVLRLAREDLNIETPGVQRVRIDDPSPTEDSPANLTSVAAPTDADALVPELSALVEDMLVRYPVAQMFVRPETRPPLMFIGAGVLGTAILLLGAPPRQVSEGNPQPGPSEAD